MVIYKGFLNSFFCLHHQNGRHDFVISVSRGIDGKLPLISNHYENMKDERESKDHNMFNSSWFSEALNNILISQLIYYIEPTIQMPYLAHDIFLRKCLSHATLQRDKVFKFV